VCVCVCVCVFIYIFIFIYIYKCFVFRSGQNLCKTVCKLDFLSIEPPPMAIWISMLFVTKGDFKIHLIFWTFIFHSSLCHFSWDSLNLKND
jgi:hypothetical protein